MRQAMLEFILRTLKPAGTAAQPAGTR
jgi:hypothetical protein